MPRIPLYNQGLGPTQQLATGQLSRRADVGAFAAPGRALTQFGETAGQIAFNFGEAQKKEQDNDAVLASKIKFNQDSEDYIKNNPTTDFQEFKDKYSAWKEGWLVSNTRNFDDRRKRLITNSINPIASIQSLEGQNRAFNLFNAEGTRDMNTNLETFKNIMANLPETDPKFLNAKKSALDIINSGNRTGRNITYKTEEDFLRATQIDRYKVKINDASDLSSLKKIDEEIKQRKDFDIDQVLVLSAAAGKKLSYFQKNAEVIFDQNIAGIEAKIPTGNANIEEIKQLDRKMKETYADNPIALDSAKQKINVLKSKLRVKNDFDEVEFEDISLRKDFVNLYRDAYQNETNTAKVLQRKGEYELAAKLYQNQQEILSKDPVGYIKSRRRSGKFPAGPNDIDELLNTADGVIAAQRILGVAESDIKLYSQDEMKQIASNYLKADDVEKPEILRNLIANAGENNKQLFKQLFENGFNYYDNLAALNLNTPLANLVLNARGFNERSLSKTEKETYKEDFASVEDNVKENLQDWGESITGNVFTGSVLSLNKRQLKKDEILSTITNVAKFLVTEGYSSNDASDRASEIILGNYSVEKINEIAFRVPATFEKDLTLIKTFAENYIKEENLLQNVGVPKQFLDKPKAYLKLSSFGWVTNSAEDGVYLVNRQDGDNAVLNKNGTKIEYKFTDMASNQSDIEAKRLADRTTPQAEARKKEKQEIRNQNAKEINNFIMNFIAGEKFKRD